MARGFEQATSCEPTTVGYYEASLLKIQVFISLCLLLSLQLSEVGSQGCVKHTFETNEFDIACVCNQTYCDKIKFNWPNEHETLAVESDKSGARFVAKLIGINSTDSNKGTTDSMNGSASGVEVLTIRLYPDRTRQKIIGFGGAFTDAASYQLQNMTKEMREFALEDYFGLDGLRYTIGRVPIGGCDFSSRAYSYLDINSTDQSQKEDLNLTRFELQPEDIELKIPIIRQARDIVENSTQHKQKLKLFGSSWSAPGWMKENDKLTKGKLKGNSSGSYYDAYARYHVKFLKEYQARGIDFWALTSQNEPREARNNDVEWNAVIIDANELRDFVRDNLGPTLADNGFGKDKLHLLVYDDQTATIEEYMYSMTNDSEAMKYVSGVAVHWYFRKSAGYKPLENIRKLLPESAIILSTEACNIGTPKPGRWQSGVEYAEDIIEASITLRRYDAGWVDWNLVLDMQGGPNWARGYVDAPILFDEEKKVYYKNPMYYVLAHFTRFFEPSAQIFESELVNSTSSEPDNDDDSLVKVIAAERPNKSHYSVVILNKAPQVKLVNIFSNDTMLFENITIKANSITTLAIPSGTKL